MKWTKPLYVKRKGRHMQASGSWKATRQEDLLIKAVGLWFTVSVLATLTASFFQIKAILAPSIISLALSFIGMFVVLFGLAYFKSREQPMEKHYYSDDYTHNGITGEITDNGREISREEFYGESNNESSPNEKEPL